MLGLRKKPVLHEVVLVAVDMRKSQVNITCGDKLALIFCRQVIYSLLIYVSCALLYLPDLHEIWKQGMLCVVKVS